MKSPLSRVMAGMWTAALVLSSAPSCGPVASTACDCADPSITVHVPTPLAAPTNSIVVSGGACDGVTPTCTQMQSGSCLSYSFLPAATGTCHIDVFLADHAFSHDLTIKRATGCCTGLFADPAGAGDVQVTREALPLLVP